MNKIPKNDQITVSIFYWLLPVSLILTSCFAIWYSLATPTVPITNLTVLQYIPTVSDKVIQNSRWGLACDFAWTIGDIAFFAAFIQTGWAWRLRDLVQRIHSNLLVQVTLFTLIYSTVQIAIFFPLTYLTQFWMSHHFGLSSQSLQAWLADGGKAALLSIILESLNWFLFFFIVIKFPKRWPAIFAAVSIPIMLFMTFINPLVFEPIFNKFEPMAPSKLQRDIQNLAQKSGIPQARILVSDQSKRTNTTNAYVNGIGSSARIVLWDTIIAKMPPEQVLCVVAHEIGHYKHNHVLWGCLIGTICILLTIPINNYLTPLFFKYCPDSWRVKSVSDIAAIPILLIYSSCFGFWQEPLFNWYSREIEHDADMFEFRVHADRVNSAKSLAFLAQENLSEPSPPPLIKYWVYSHPSLADRIESAIIEK